MARFAIKTRAFSAEGKTSFAAVALAPGETGLRYLSIAADSPVLAVYVADSAAGANARLLTYGEIHERTPGSALYVAPPCWVPDVSGYLSQAGTTARLLLCDGGAGGPQPRRPTARPAWYGPDVTMAEVAAEASQGYDTNPIGLITVGWRKGVLHLNPTLSGTVTGTGYCQDVPYTLAGTAIAAASNLCGNFALSNGTLHSAALTLDIAEGFARVWVYYAGGVNGGNFAIAHCTVNLLGEA